MSLAQVIKAHQLDLKNITLHRDPEDGDRITHYTMHCACGAPIEPSSDPDVNELADHQAWVIEGSAWLMNQRDAAVRAHTNTEGPR